MMGKGRDGVTPAGGSSSEVRGEAGAGGRALGVGRLALGIGGGVCLSGER